jgi:hypothetical protein
MPGLVFLSCGQNDRELQIAERLRSLLEESPLNLQVFIARSTNNLYSLNNDVLENLGFADYVIFVNFYRERNGLRGSLYAHQELAMALAVGHRRLLIYSEQNAPTEGVISFIVQNRTPLSTPEQLLEQVRDDVAREEWRADYSRFVDISELVQRENIRFADGAGNILSGPAIGVRIANPSNDLQESVIITLERLDGNEPKYEFRSPLKVSGQRRYDAAIPPGGAVIFDILMDGICEPNRRGAFPVTALDLAPLPTLFDDINDHQLVFRIDARARRPVRFTLVRRDGDYKLA